MVELMKNAFRKPLEMQIVYTFKQPKDVLLLEVEIILKNRPLGYLEDDIIFQLQHLTPNGMTHGANISLLELGRARRTIRSQSNG
jgi:hypothetical protein